MLEKTLNTMVKTIHKQQGVNRRKITVYEEVEGPNGTKLHLPISKVNSAIELGLSVKRS